MTNLAALLPSFLQDVLSPLFLGILTAIATAVGSHRALRDCELEPGCWPWIFGVIGLILGALFAIVSLHWNWLSTPEVIPTEFWRKGRVYYHLSLISLLMIITATDLRSFYIVTWCCWLGIVIGVAGAVFSGEFQLAHVWVDWNAEVPQIRGPEIPRWLSAHPHLHGLAWSLTGLFSGVAITAMTRWLSSFVLGMNTLGSGDVYLMAMVGAYLGWQPTIVVFLLAPILAMLVGGIVRLVSNRSAIPYGPFLALASLIVLFTWRLIWMAEFSLAAGNERDPLNTFAVRRFFGDPIAMLIVAAIAIIGLVVLLALLRLYKSITVK